MSSVAAIEKSTSPPVQRPLRIAHVNAESGFYGGESQLFLLVEGLRQRGHSNLLLCRPGSSVEAEARARGLDARLVPMRHDVDVRSVLALQRALEASNADIAHLHTGRATWLGGLAARAAGVPAIATRRMDRRVRPGVRTRLIHGSLLQRTVAISPAVADRLGAAGVNAARTHTIPSAVDPESLASRRGRDAIRRNCGLAPGDALLLALSALVRRKGLDVLLVAVAKLAAEGLRPQVWIAGDGPERAALERLRLELDLAAQVRLLGRRDDVPDLLAACDALVLPSRREGLGVAALEAAAVGRPVVASRVGGLADVVQDGRTGLVVPPDDPDALAQALRQLVEKPTLRARLGEAGRDSVRERFLADAMTDAYERLYREVLAEDDRR